MGVLIVIGFPNVEEAEQVRSELVKTSLSHVDEDKLRDLIKTSAQQAEALLLA